MNQISRYQHCHVKNVANIQITTNFTITVNPTQCGWGDACFDLISFVRKQYKQAYILIFYVLRLLRSTTSTVILSNEPLLKASLAKFSAPFSLSFFSLDLTMLTASSLVWVSHKPSEARTKIGKFQTKNLMFIS